MRKYLGLHASRFGGKIAQGMLYAGYIAGVIGTELPGAILVAIDKLNFKRPVRIGDIVTVTVQIAQYIPEKEIAVFWSYNHKPGK